MIREMIKNKQQLSEADCTAVLMRNTNGVLAVMGDDGYPYGVPLNYVYLNNRIYFHCAKKGYKIDCMEKASKVCFTVVDLDEIHPEDITSYFRSVIIMGRARRAEGSEYIEALKGIADKYMAEMPESVRKAAVDDCGFGGAFLYAIDVDHISGKQASELL